MSFLAIDQWNNRPDYIVINYIVYLGDRQVANSSFTESSDLVVFIFFSSVVSSENTEQTICKC